jgi:PTS system N-acetylglucosamine-specific IIC component
MVLMDLLKIRLGFSFSAGLFDYVLNFSHAQRPLWLLPIGAVYFGLYYGVFRVCIARFGLATPGREAEESAPPPGAVAAGDRPGAFIAALGGAGNLTEVEACTTRLRLAVVDAGRVDERALKRLGARGIVSPGPNVLQVVLGPMADQVAGEIRSALRTPERALKPTDTRAGHDAQALVAALGGRANVLDLVAVPGRLLLKLARTEILDERALEGLGVRGIARSGADSLQVLVAGPVEATAGPLRAVLARS